MFSSAVCWLRSKVENRKRRQSSFFKAVFWLISKVSNVHETSSRDSRAVFLLTSKEVKGGPPMRSLFSFVFSLMSSWVTNLFCKITKDSSSVKNAMPVISLSSPKFCFMSSAFTAAISPAERELSLLLSKLSLTYCRKLSSGKFVSSIATSPAARAAVGSSVSTMQQSSRMLRSLFLMVLFLRFLCNRLIWSLQFFCSLTRLLRPPPFSCGTLPQQQNGDSVASPCPLPTA